MKKLRLRLHGGRSGHPLCSGLDGQPDPSLRPPQGQHAAAPGKSGTCSVEGDNAELRHYRARLGRKSRRFSRRLEALARHVKLFVFCCNARQLFVPHYPKLKAHLNCNLA